MTASIYPVAGSTDPATGRVAVRVSDFARSELNGEADAFWPDGAAWRRVDAVDIRPSGFEVCFADGRVRHAGSMATFFVEPGVAARIAA